MASFLFLQGPHGPFFRLLGEELRSRGHEVMRVNLCGGDVLDWPHGALCYHGRTSDWSAWVHRLMMRRKVTDLMVFGDWRPHHREAVHIARLNGIRVWAFDEGYLRPHWITMERGGVNGNSTLPHTPEEVRAESRRYAEPSRPESSPNPIASRQLQAVLYAGASILSMPFFPFYRTHRPYGHLKELFSGWVPHFFTRRRRMKLSEKALSHINDAPFFLFPLQLDSDSQVRRYSPFSGMKEAIAWVMTSFAKDAPKETHLVIRNHPLDSGLIRYDRFIRSFSEACGIADRVIFVESGNGMDMIRKSRAVVLLNSTMGMQALEQGKAVYCVGKSIYAMPGLAQSSKECSLSRFWTAYRTPDAGLLHDFEKLLLCRALVNGNFYFGRGLELAVRGCADRLEKSAASSRSAAEIIPR
ncbi:capsular biosynthesis protein [uncultured Mailhella sp.]|uniref:capsule biosynthesis protein n=1 Tax=uncultured Mailhella sp. TaxID=1981031 RepID=UPI0025EE9097|nr:capsular biosynthesis protein [uncultured Mailhella sp.]